MRLCCHLVTSRSPILDDESVVCRYQGLHESNSQTSESTFSYKKGWLLYFTSIQYFSLTISTSTSTEPIQNVAEVEADKLKTFPSCTDFIICSSSTNFVCTAMAAT